MRHTGISFCMTIVLDPALRCTANLCTTSHGFDRLTMTGQYVLRLAALAQDDTIETSFDCAPCGRFAQDDMGVRLRALRALRSG